MRCQSEVSAGAWASRVCLYGLGLLLVVLSGCGDNGHLETAGSSGAGGHTSAGESSARLDDASLIEILQHPDMLMRVEKIAAHLQTLSPEDLEETRRLFESASFNRGDLEYTLFGEWWARFDAPAAQRWADLTMKARHPRVIASIVRAWAKQDPESAAASKRFMKVQAGAPIYRADLLDALIVGWFDSGKDGLEGFIQTLGGEDQTRALRSYARVRSTRDGLRETLEWSRRAEGFTEAEQRLLMAGALEVVAGQDPRLAAEYLEIARKDGVDTRTFIARIAGSWAEFDYKGAMRWLATAEDSPDRNRGVGRVAGEWVKDEPESLDTYLEENKGEKWLDQVRVMIARRAVKLNQYRPDWNKVMRDIDGIVQDDRRWSTRAWVLQRWFVVDEGAANAYLLGDSDLSDAMRARAREINPATRKEIEKAFNESALLRVD